MKVGFKVDRIGFYRLFGSLVEEAQRRGWDVVLLHSEKPQDRIGPKSYQWADPEAIPAFAGGRPLVRQWQSERSFYEICRSERINALVTIWAISEAVACDLLRDEGVAWAALQESHEFHVFPLQMLLRPDITCMFSEWWIDLVERHYRGDRALIRSHLVATGWPELDTFGLVDRTRVRQRLGIPGSRPVVTLTTYKHHPDDAWEQVVFRSDGPVSAVARALAGRRPDLVAVARQGPFYSRFIAALRSFCDRNGAVLVSKARGKDRPPKVETQLADIAMFDQGYHPATIVELTAITDVFVSFMSAAMLEGVYGGAYGVCPMPPERSGWLRSPASSGFRESMAYREPGSMWNFPGVVLQATIVDLIRDLPSMSLSELRPDAEARSRYVRRFLTADDHAHAERTWAAIEEVVDRRASRSRPVSSGESGR